MRSILEKALIALLNEEREKADALFHDFILERSRQIHESLRQGEDFVLDESWEQEFAMEEGLTEDDLMDDDTSEDETVEEASDEEVAGEGDEVAADDSVEDDVAGDDAAVEGDDEVGGEDEGSIEDRVTDLEAELQRLSAEFDAIAGAEDELEGDLADHEAQDAQMFGTDVVGDEVTSDDEFAPEVEEESFDPLGESAEAVAGLKTVKVDMKTSKEQGGKTVKQNNKSPGMQPKLDDRAFKGEPVEVNAEEHKGYERETAPTSKVMQKRTNTMAKGDSNLVAAKKAGAEKALINDLKADPKAQTSPLTPVGKK